MLGWGILALLLSVTCAQKTTEPPTDAPSGTGTGTGTGTGNREADGPTPRVFRRVIPADVLRDFPNFCFASTACKLYEPGQSWSLAPFCGHSHCMFDERSGRFFEVVLDCGPKPRQNAKCKITKPGNTTAQFPECCDVYDLEHCEFPDLEPPTREPSAPDAPGGGNAAEGTPVTDSEGAQPVRVRPGRPGQGPGPNGPGLRNRQRAAARARNQQAQAAESQSALDTQASENQPNSP